MFRKIIRNIRFDIQREVYSPFLYVMNTLTIIMLCIGLLFDRGRFEPNSVDWTLRFTLGITGTSALLPLIVSLLCTITHSAWHRIDITTGYTQYYLSRTDRRSYIISRCVSAFLLGVLSILGGLLICLFICYAFFPAQQTNEEWLPVFLFSNLYSRSPIIYCLVLIGNTCLHAGIYSMVGLALSTLSGKIYTAIIGPFAVSLVLHVLFSVLGFPGLSPLSLIMLEFNSNTTALQIYGEALATLVVCIAVFAFCSKKDIVL